MKNRMVDYTLEGDHDDGFAKSRCRGRDSGGEEIRVLCHYDVRAVKDILYTLKLGEGHATVTSPKQMDGIDSVRWFDLRIDMPHSRVPLFMSFALNGITE